MANIEDVQAAIEGAINHSGHAVKGTEAVRTSTGDTLRAARATTQGSTHHTVVDGLARLDEAQRETGSVLHLLNTSTEAAREYHRSLA